MDRLEEPMDRRGFLKKGIMSGVGVLMIGMCPGKAALSGIPQRDTHSLELHRIIRKYGGEFGPTKGGL